MERREPRLALPRLGLAAALGVGGVAMLALAGVKAVGFVQRYIHGREIHAQEPGRIELVPEPPPWIKPGRAGLLKLIAPPPEQGRTSALDLDLGQIVKDLPKLSPWIKHVRRVERSYPNRVVVRIDPGDYREPVARIILEGKDPKDQVEIPVDDQGVVLPGDQIDWHAAGPLILIKGKGLPPPEVAEAREGRSLKFARSPDGEPRPDPRIEEAVRLAGFLKRKRQGNGPDASPMRAEGINIDARGVFWVWDATRTFYVRWDDPGLPRPVDGDPTAHRWDRLRSWFDGRKPPFLGPGQHLDATGDRILVVTERASGGSSRPASH